MSSTNVNIAGRTFVCVRLAEAGFSDIAAVYVILCVSHGGQWPVLDVGQSGQLGSRIDSHKRKACWERNCVEKNIWVCIYKMPSHIYSAQDRRDFERQIRGQYNPPCGER